MTDLPWMVEAKRLLGRHETFDRSSLMKWLRSDVLSRSFPAGRRR